MLITWWKFKEFYKDSTKLCTTRSIEREMFVYKLWEGKLFSVKTKLNGFENFEKHCLFSTRSMDEFSHLAELPEVNPVPPFCFWKSNSSEKQLSPKEPTAPWGKSISTIFFLEIKIIREAIVTKEIQGSFSSWRTLCSWATLLRRNCPRLTITTIGWSGLSQNHFH